MTPRESPFLNSNILWNYLEEFSFGLDISVLVECYFEDFMNVDNEQWKII